MPSCNGKPGIGIASPTGIAVLVDCRPTRLALKPHLAQVTLISCKSFQTVSHSFSLDLHARGEVASESWGKWRMAIGNRSNVWPHYEHCKLFVWPFGGGVWSAGPSDLTEALCEISAKA